MKTDFNRFGVFGTGKSIPPKDSWWAAPELQHDRAAFEKRLVDEELRMMSQGKFAGRGRTHDKGMTEK